MSMKCEHCGDAAMIGWIICRRCWRIVFGEESFEA